MVKLVAEHIDLLIGRRIQNKRKELGYSADKLSEHIGISQQQLSRYERGTNKINVSHLIKISTFLNTPISWFFEDCFYPKNNIEITKWDQYWQSLSEDQKKAFVEFSEKIKGNS